jgi:hypothetical protein
MLSLFSGEEVRRMKKRIVGLFGVLLVLLVLAFTPAAFAHQVVPPGSGTCTTNVHAGDPLNPAHELGFTAHASDRSPAVTTGFCTTP